jgi:hypothetical protein
MTIKRFFKASQALPIPDHLQGCSLTTHVNPALLLIALNQYRSLHHLLLGSGPAAESLHLTTLLSKPQMDPEGNEEDDLDEEVDGYGVRLAIRNKNEDVIRLLIDGDDEDGLNRIAQIWNVGHILNFLREIVRVEWHDGLPFIFGLRRVSQLFSCVSDPENFLTVVNELIEIFFEPPGTLQDEDSDDESEFAFRQLLLSALEEEPYKSYLVFLRMYQGDPEEQILPVAKSIERNHMPFFREELLDLFR